MATIESGRFHAGMGCEMNRDASLRVSAAADALAGGRAIVVIVDQDAGAAARALVVAAAQFATTGLVGFMVANTSGFLCVPMRGGDLERLGVPPMTPFGADGGFQVSVDASAGISTGISARDRAQTIKVLADPEATPADLCRPGHVVPWRASTHGVLGFAGPAEAAVDLVVIAGLGPVAVAAELMDDQGDLASPVRAHAFADRHDLRVVSVADVVAYRMSNERTLPMGPECTVRGGHGEFAMRVYSDSIRTGSYIVLTRGELTKGAEISVFVHVECVSGNLFGGNSCGCRQRLEAAMLEMASCRVAALVYARTGMPGSCRGGERGPEALCGISYGAARALREAGVQRARLVPGNLEIAAALQDCGVSVDAESSWSASRFPDERRTGSRVRLCR